MLGYVLLSDVLFAPGIEPADLPSHSYRNRNALGAGCSVMLTQAVGYGLDAAGRGREPPLIFELFAPLFL